MKNSAITGIVIVLFSLILFPEILTALDGPYYFNQFPAKGKVTMIDLGADYCIPCKMMEPILTKITKKYRDKVDIVFIDVSQNKEQALRFRIRVIPTQIFFNFDQKEVYRHEGFMGEKDIESRLESMGVKY